MVNCEIYFKSAIKRENEKNTSELFILWATQLELDLKALGLYVDLPIVVECQDHNTLM